MCRNSYNRLNQGILLMIVSMLVLFLTYVGISLDKDLTQSQKNYQKLTEAYRQLEVENMILKGKHFQNKP